MRNIKIGFLYIVSLLTALLLGGVWELVFAVYFHVNTGFNSWVWSSFGFAIGTVGIVTIAISHREGR